MAAAPIAVGTRVVVRHDAECDDRFSPAPQAHPYAGRPYVAMHRGRRGTVVRHDGEDVGASPGDPLHVVRFDGDSQARPVEDGVWREELGRVRLVAPGYDRGGR